MASDLLQAAGRDPYGFLELLLGGRLHPGGEQATHWLLDRAEVGPNDRLVDLGCGAGSAVAQARERGAHALGVDQRKSTGTDLRGRIERLPLAEDRFDVVLSECSLCLTGDLDGALREAARILAPGGRLAFSDVTVARALPEVPDTIAELFCLQDPRSQETILRLLETQGFRPEHVRDHHEELHTMRDRVHERVDVDGLLAALGDRGKRIRRSLDMLEEALEAGDIGYVAIVARLA